MSSQQFVQGISIEKARIRPQNESKASSSYVADPRSGEYLQPRYYEMFLSIIGENDASLMAKASMNFDKQALISIHERALQNLTHPQAAEILSMNLEIHEGTYEATEAAAEHVPLSVTDLKIGKRNEGVVIFGELCVEPLQIGRIYTLLEEAGTGKAVALCIAAPYERFASLYFPQGTKIALKEPMLIQGERDLVFVHVENSLSIELVQSFPALRDIKVTVGNDKFKKWMEFGYMSYRAKDWENCIRYYSKCVACLFQGMREDAYAINVMYTQRCVAYAELHRHEEAAQDADKFEPFDKIGAEFKIRSLLSVGRYKAAFYSLHRSCDRFPENTQILTAYYRKWSAACFDIGEALIDPAAGSSRILKPDADFIGPVEIKMTSHGCGRGLFATEKILEGEVLLISKALAVSKNREKKELLQNVKEKLKSCGEKTRQMFFSHKFKDLSCLVPCMSDFITESAGEYLVPTETNEEAAIPGERYKMVDYMDPNKATFPVLERIALNDSSPSAMQRICKQSLDLTPVQIRHYYGAWLLPSFINHSCAPNAARINVGDIMRIHAATEISAGEEISIPYFNVLIPYNFREEACKSFRFKCLCERCKLEKKVMENEQKTIRLYRDFLRLSICKPEKLDAQLRSIDRQVEMCLNVLKRMVNVDQDIEFFEGWIRASFTPVYFALLENRWRLGMSTAAGVKIEQETLYNAASAILATCPGSLQCLIFFRRCLSLWQNRAGLYAQSGSPSFEVIYEGRVIAALNSLKEAFPSVYGHQREHVVQAILKKLY